MFRRHWMRHTARVPKGFLRYHVLESLSEKPMSGSEIINEVGSKTSGQWKPSPGSIYPLLAWLQDDGYIKELPSKESGMKRYTLTDKGKSLLVEERKIKEKLDKEVRFFGPPFLGPFMGPWGLRIPPGKAVEIRSSMKRFMKALFRLGTYLDSESSEKVIEESLKVLDEASEKLENIAKNLTSEPHERRDHKS